LNPRAPARTKGSEENDAMRFGRTMAVLAVLPSIAGSPALAAVCLDKSMTLEEIVDTINASPGCERAMKVFEDCEYGASGDVQLGRRDEMRGGLPVPAQGVAEESLCRRPRRCDAKYTNKEGTMYRSFTAFCRAEVSQRYSRQALKAVGPKAR
jgi:hypothetical protein